MNEPAVAVHGLTKVFPIPFQRRSVVAVRDLNLRVEPGEVYGLLGPNGSGKSTTLKIILGLVTPDRGRTEIFGCDSREVKSRVRVGFLPENPYFYKYLTGEETIRFFGKLCGPRANLWKNGSGRCSNWSDYRKPDIAGWEPIPKECCSELAWPRRSSMSRA